MKKFLFAAYMIFLVTLVPAVIFAYLHSDNSGKNNKTNTEISKEISNGREDADLLHLVKTF